MSDSHVSSEPAVVHRRPLTKGARTRQRLLEIASAEFARHGYERSRVSDVVAKAALTQPVFYQYFSSKRSDEHTSELQSLMRISYAVFCLKKKPQQTTA